jgi:hypothetical protein
LIGELSVRPGAAVGNPLQRFPASELERSAAQIKGKGEFAQISAKIGIELFFAGAKLVARLDPEFIGRRTGKVCTELQPREALLRSCQQQSADRRLHPGIKDFAPLEHNENGNSKRVAEKFKPYNTRMAILIYFNTAAKNRSGLRCVTRGDAQDKKPDLAATKRQILRLIVEA